MPSVTSNRLKALKELLLAAKEGASPVVRESNLAKGALATEKDLTAGQKIIQKTDIGSYKSMLEKLKGDQAKRLAGVGGAIGATSLLSQEDAQAAGIETIAKTLGVGLEEAAKIKKLAHTAPPSVFEDNIKAIQSISNFKKNPDEFKRLGSGMDYKAFEVPNGQQVIKEPKMRTVGDDISKVAPPLVNEANLGPKTKIISLGDRDYMVQDKVSPLDSIIKKSQRPGQDLELEKLYKKSDDIWKNVDISDKQAVAAINNSPEYKSLEKAIESRQENLIKQQGVDVDQLKSLDPTSDPETAFENLMRQKAQSKLNPVVQPEDLHSGNIGLDQQGNPTIFDTSRFGDFKPENLTPEMKANILNSNISLPEKKKALEALINPERQQLGKAAAIAPVGLSTSSPSNFLGQPATQLADLYNQYVQKPISDVSEKIGEKVSSTMSPKQYMRPELQEQYSDQGDIAVKNLVKGGAELALDPTNYVAPAVGLPLSAAQQYFATPEEENNDLANRQQAISKLKGGM